MLRTWGADASGPASWPALATGSLSLRNRLMLSFASRPPLVPVRRTDASRRRSWLLGSVLVCGHGHCGKKGMAESMRGERSRLTFPVRGLLGNSSTSGPKPSHSSCRRCPAIRYKVHSQHRIPWGLNPRAKIPSGDERALVTNPGWALGGDGVTLIWRNDRRGIALSNLGPEVDEAAQFGVALRAFAYELFHHGRWMSRGRRLIRCWMRTKARPIA